MQRVKTAHKPDILTPPPPAPPSKKKLIVSGPYLLEISHLVILKLIDASHKRKLFQYRNCVPLRPRINRKAILVCSTSYSKSDVFATKDGKMIFFHYYHYYHCVTYS